MGLLKSIAVGRPLLLAGTSVGGGSRGDNVVFVIPVDAGMHQVSSDVRRDVLGVVNVTGTW